MTSAHFQDFAPTEVPTRPPGYSQVMRGAGRWFVMVDTVDEALFGVLWTNDRDALGLMALEGSSRDHVMSVLGELASARVAGISATDEFNQLLQGYRPEVYGEGDLSELLDL